MINKTWSRKTIAFCLAVAILSVYSMVVLATPSGISGELSIKGNVTVNGQAAVSGTTIFTDSVITTGDNSSATVNLGKLGRVELLANSSLKINFNDSGISGTLSMGRVRISSNVSAIINTLDGVVIAEGNQNNAFLVDTTCGNTQVTTIAGNVTLRSSGSDKQVAAGKDASSGQATGGTRCSRLAGAQTTSNQLSGGAWAAILLAAGGAIIGAIIAGTSDNDSNVGGGTTVISPIR
jgi:ferric-dicitrate binding protein FerR (iron transport regulator)